MGNHPSNHQPLERGMSKFGEVNTRRSLRSPRKMDRLRRSFRDSFRRRKERVPESSKPHQWQADESAVRSGTCTFAVKYLGCVEVFESRGMQVCEEALKVLRGSRRRPVRAVLHVSGDGLRVVEDDTKGLIVDQTIEKVSFCAPDRNHERGFSYICRDGTTRRWMCHGFLAMRETGERLSHAVGCAFAVCLERKQKRDKECGVTMMFDAKNSTFTRSGSFRQQGLTERLEREVEVGPRAAPVNPFAIERPHATPSMLQRQGSFRGLGTLGQSSPFKRQMSLRVNDLPSNAERLSAYRSVTTPTGLKTVSPIPENVPADSVTALCQQLSQGLSQLTHSGSDDFNFNSQSSVNQNNLTISITNTTNTFNQSISATPTPPPSSNITPVSLNFSPIRSATPLSNQTSLSNQSLTNSLATQSVGNQSVGNQSVSNHSIGSHSIGSQSIGNQSMGNPLGQHPVGNQSYGTQSVLTTSLTNRPLSNQMSLINQTPLVNSLGNQIATSEISTNQTSMAHQLMNRSPSNRSPNPGIDSTLPKPDQWLGQIVNSTTPTPMKYDGIPVRRSLPLSAHSRAMSLDSSESFPRSTGPDPFDAEWASLAARQNTNNTNPFLTSNATPQPFQIQL